MFSLFAALLGVFAVGLYGVVVYFFIRFGLEGIDMIKEWVKAAAGLAG